LAELTVEVADLVVVEVDQMAHRRRIDLGRVLWCS
jgi:hypothetical protein